MAHEFFANFRVAACRDNSSFSIYFKVVLYRDMTVDIKNRLEWPQAHYTVQPQIVAGDNVDFSDSSGCRDNDNTFRVYTMCLTTLFTGGHLNSICPHHCALPNRKARIVHCSIHCWECFIVFKSPSLVFFSFNYTPIFTSPHITSRLIE